MTLFRYKENGLLYIIYRVSPGQMAGRWYEAHPYRHNVEIGIKQKSHLRRFRHNMSLDDFVPVASC